MYIHTHTVTNNKYIIIKGNSCVEKLCKTIVASCQEGKNSERQEVREEMTTLSGCVIIRFSRIQLRVQVLSCAFLKVLAHWVPCVSSATSISAGLFVCWFRVVCMFVCVLCLLFGLLHFVALLILLIFKRKFVVCLCSITR